MERFRAEFSHLNYPGVYLDHAAVSPLNQRSYKYVQTFLRQAQGKRINNYQETMDLMNALHVGIGRLIHAPADRIALVRNTTDGLILLARGYPWKPGDRIVLHRREFPSNVYPWWELQQSGVILDFLDTPEGRVDPAALETVVTPRTRLVTVSWVQYFNGLRNALKPLVEWCHERNILVAVDVMQGLGQLELNVADIGMDFLATGTAKWLLGPQGLGFVYLTDALQEELHPPHLGWQSRASFWDFHRYDQPLKAGAGRYEFATPFSLGVWWFKGSLELLEEAGPARIERRILSLRNKLISRLEEIGLDILSPNDNPREFTGIVVCSLGDEERNAQLHAFLQDRNIIVSLRNGLLRISPHFYNTEEDLDEIQTAIRDFQSQQ
ncbi:MAG: aminotransferase class V-fold PLP-dependent enzyme [Candidatus Neomarinimicrobiota bacterium]|nr:MAG: aminotransferase class V-fold PLP-dependent enzyme [Candidatus Neomarinimicrobiota bacterium]